MLTSATYEKIFVCGPSIITGKVTKLQEGWAWITTSTGERLILPGWFIQRREKLPPVTLD